MTTYSEAVEQTITAGEQIHQIVNGTATTEVTVEDGSKVPSIRKALLDNFYFKDPIAWQVGQTENVFNQLRQFTDGSWWYAPSATAINPVSMGSTPVGDVLWKIYDFDAIGKLTPQIREALRRSYAEAGYNLVDGSFEAGGTLVNANDVLLQERTGKAFSGPAGTVAARTNPASGGFVDKSGELASASAISNANGGSVQDFIDNIDQVHTRTFANVAAMLAFNGHVVGQRYSTGATTWEYLGGGNTIDKFKALNAVNVIDFGAVADGVTNDTAAFVNALATGFDVFAPSGTYLITSPLNVNLQRLYGQNGNKTTLKFNHSGGGFAITVMSGERGGGVDGFAMDAVVDGLKGLNMKGTVIARCNQVFINNFTDISLKLGDTPTGGGIYWSKIGMVRIRLDSAKNGNTGVLIDGQATPGSNDNSLEDVVIGGNFQRPLHIKGIGNTVKNGTIELTRGNENVVSMIYIEGSGNRIQDMYIEPTGAAPSKLVEFGPNSSGNEIEIWPQYILPYNVSAAVIDNGAHNKVKLKRLGGSFKIGPESEPSSNLLMNSAFKVWRDAENPRGWLFGTAGQISRVAPTLVGEPATLQMTVSGNNATIQAYLNDYFASTSGATPYDLEYLRGKPVIAGVWCKTTITGAGGIKIGNIGGDSSSYGADSHSGSGNWELLIAHRQIPEASTRLWVELRSDPNNAARTGTVDFRDPFVILGSDVSYFTPKSVSDSGGQMFGDLEFPLDYTDKGCGGILRLGASYVWADTTGKLRIGGTRPTNATWNTAGAVVGTQT